MILSVQFDMKGFHLMRENNCLASEMSFQALGFAALEMFRDTRIRSLIPCINYTLKL